MADTYIDLTDKLAGSLSSRLLPSDPGPENRDSSKGFVIHFLHIPTSTTCHFKAFITDYEDQYDSQWNEEEVFGRMDPISTFKRTRRKIRLGWAVPSASEDEAILNLRESEKLLSMLYPVFEERTARNFSGDPVTSPTGERKVGVMVAPPLFKIKFANLIMDGDVGQISGDVGHKDAAAKSGLVGTISGLSYRPDIDQGFFGGWGGGIDPGALVPQTINFDLEFVVHHQHGLGYSRSAVKSNPLFDPLGAGGEQLVAKRARGFPHRADKILKSRG